MLRQTYIVMTYILYSYIGKVKVTIDFGNTIVPGHFFYLLPKSNKCENSAFKV